MTAVHAITLNEARLLGKACADYLAELELTRGRETLETMRLEREVLWRVEQHFHPGRAEEIDDVLNRARIAREDGEPACHWDRADEAMDARQMTQSVEGMF